MPITLLQAAPAGNPFLGFLPMIAIFAIFYFFIIRPQQKRDRDRKALIAEVKKGDKIITVGGIHATVAQVDDSTVLAQVDPSVKIRIEKSAIGQIVAA